MRTEGGDGGSVPEARAAEFSVGPLESTRIFELVIG